MCFHLSLAAKHLPSPLCKDRLHLSAWNLRGWFDYTGGRESCARIESYGSTFWENYTLSQPRTLYSASSRGFGEKKQGKMLLCLKHQPLFSESARKCAHQTMNLVSSSPGVALTILPRINVCINWEMIKRKRKLCAPPAGKRGSAKKSGPLPPWKSHLFTALCVFCVDDRNRKLFNVYSQVLNLGIWERRCIICRPLMKIKHT